MSRWSQASPAWDPVLKGNPASSSYFWMAIIFSLSALLGVAKAASQVYENYQDAMLWLPSLAGALLLMALAAGGAIRAIRAARALATEASETSAAAARKAFAKFRIYFFCAAFVTLATWTLVTFK